MKLEYGYNKEISLDRRKIKKHYRKYLFDKRYSICLVYNVYAKDETIKSKKKALSKFMTSIFKLINYTYSRGVVMKIYVSCRLIVSRSRELSSRKYIEK